MPYLEQRAEMRVSSPPFPLYEGAVQQATDRILAPTPRYANGSGWEFEFTHCQRNNPYLFRLLTLGARIQSTQEATDTLPEIYASSVYLTGGLYVYSSTRLQAEMKGLPLPLVGPGTIRNCYIDSEIKGQGLTKSTVDLFERFATGGHEDWSRKLILTAIYRAQGTPSPTPDPIVRSHLSKCRDLLTQQPAFRSHFREKLNHVSRHERKLIAMGMIDTNEVIQRQFELDRMRRIWALETQRA